MLALNSIPLRDTFSETRLIRKRKIYGERETKRVSSRFEEYTGSQVIPSLETRVDRSVSSSMPRQPSSLGKGRDENGGAREKENETTLYRMAGKVKRLKRLMGFEYIPGRGVGWGEVLFMPTCLAYEVGGNVVLIFIGEK